MNRYSHNFKEYNPLEGANKNTLIIGGRASGKSWVCRDLILRKNIPTTIVISSSEREDLFYSKFMDKRFIYHEITEKLLNEIIIHQRQMLEKEKCEKYDARMLLVFDTPMFYFNKVFKSVPFREIIFNGVYYKIEIIMTCQMRVHELDEIYGRIMLTYDNNRLSIKKHYKHHGKMFPTLSDFDEAFQKITRTNNIMHHDEINYNMMVLDTTTNIEDVKWFKARRIRDDEFIDQRTAIPFAVNNEPPEKIEVYFTYNINN